MPNPGVPGRKPHVLIVENEGADVAALAARLKQVGYRATVVHRAAAATLILGESGCDLLIAALDMPGTNGRTLFEESRMLCPDLPMIVISDNDRVPDGARAIREGADEFVVRPLVPELVEVYVDRAIDRRRSLVENGAAEGHLRESVREKTKKLRLALTEMQGTFNATVEAMVSAIEARDCETQHHCRRAREYTLLLGRQMDLDPRALRDLAWGALLHDVGKIGVPDQILLKKGPLTTEERSMMRLHPLIGYRLLAPVKFLNGALSVVLSHHEKWDGSGYPYGKHGEAIPLSARIFMVADAFETITSKRSYKEARSYEYAEQEITSCAGSHFDPDVVEVFRQLGRDEWLKIRNRYLEKEGDNLTIAEGGDHVTLARMS